MSLNDGISIDAKGIQDRIVLSNGEDSSSVTVEDSSPPSNLGIALARAEHQFFIQNKTRSVFVRNLPFHFRDTHLRKLIVSLVTGGDSSVQQCRVKYSALYDNQSRELRPTKTLQLGLVMLRTAMHAQEVIKNLNASPRCCGRDLRANLFNSNAEMETSQDGSIHYTFKFSQLEPQVTEDVVREHLESEFEEVSTISIRAHFWKSDHQEGYGFVDFASSRVNNSIYTEESVQIRGVIYSFNKIKPREGKKRKHSVVGQGRNTESAREHREKTQNRQMPSRAELSHFPEHSRFQHSPYDNEYMDSFSSLHQPQDVANLPSENINVPERSLSGIHMNPPQIPIHRFPFIPVPGIDHSALPGPVGGGGYVSSHTYHARSMMDVPSILQQQQPHAPIMQVPYPSFDMQPANVPVPNPLFIQQSHQQVLPPGRILPNPFLCMNYTSLISPHFYWNPLCRMNTAYVDMNAFPMQGFIRGSMNLMDISMDSNSTSNLINSSVHRTTPDLADVHSHDNV